jgi:hypothetical protein
MDGSVPNLSEQVAGLLAGTIDLNQFQDWFIANETAIEQRGTDGEVEFLNTVENVLAEYTGDHISAGVLLEALREEYELYVSDRELAAASR